MECCNKEVRVIKFGYGYVATCPICKKVVYNAKEKPRDTSRRILKRKPWSGHPDDGHLQIVLAEVGGLHPYVTWGYNHYDKGYFGGRYFKTYREARDDFERR